MSTTHNTDTETHEHRTADQVVTTAEFRGCACVDGAEERQERPAIDRWFRWVNVVVKIGWGGVILVSTGGGVACRRRVWW